jgi:sulfur-oxidizing protein SoxY
MKTEYKRRKFVQGLLAFTALALVPLRLLARNTEAFKATATDDVFSKLFGDKPLTDSDQIDFKVPDIAEDGSTVPVSVATKLPDVKSITLIVDNNPNPLAAKFNLMPGSVADISTRIKMGESSNVRALVETDSSVYVVQKEVKVTLGGCGG